MWQEVGLDYRTCKTYPLVKGVEGTEVYLLGETSPNDSETTREDIMLGPRPITNWLSERFLAEENKICICRHV